MPPSPTDAATRFTDPDRISPTAKIPGALVSRANGSRSAFHCPAFIASVPVKTKPCLSREISAGRLDGFAVPAVDGDDLFNWSSWCRPECFAGSQATDGQQASLDVGIRNPEQVTDLGFVGEMKCGHT